MAEPLPWLPLTTPSGRGVVSAGRIEMPTLLKPYDCSCSWTVIHQAPGLQAISRLSYRNAMCPRGTEHDRAIREARQQ